MDYRSQFLQDFIIPHDASVVGAAFVTVLGLAMGSFGNVLIHRLPRGEGIGGRSRCPRCGRTLGFLELIPVVSFLALRGRCAGCRERISPRYPLTELGSAAAFLLAFARDPSLVAALTLALALWLLLLIAIVDAEHRSIPDALNIPFLLLAVLHAALAPPFEWSGLLVGGGFFAAQWLVSGGRWIGSGDLILGAGIGALLERWELAIVFLFVSYVTGAAVGGSLLLAGRKTRKDPLAFGPFLAIGGVVAFLWGDEILERIL